MAHDASTKRDLGVTKIGKGIIGNNVFIGLGTIVLPNIKIGNNVIIGAGSVVTKDIKDDCIVAGNPAVVLGSKTNYLVKHEMNLVNRLFFDYKWTDKGGITKEMKYIMNTKLEDGIGHVK